MALTLPLPIFLKGAFRLELSGTSLYFTCPGVLTSGTPIEKQSKTEFVAQVGKSKWRIAANDDPECGGWAGWINGHKVIETSENRKLILMDGAFQTLSK